MLVNSKKVDIVDGYTYPSDKNALWFNRENGQLMYWDGLKWTAGNICITEKSRDDLLELRNSGKLIPGNWYRITDYTCTTSTPNTQSAGHVFDIIVRADDESHFNENAYATCHEGDTYFENAHLEAWELKYCIDNDTSRFAWADAENGKGVIYYMKDDRNNECSYDFKNIMFRRWAITSFNDCPDVCYNATNNPNHICYGAKDILTGDNVISGATYDNNVSMYYYTFTLMNEGVACDQTILYNVVMNNNCIQSANEDGTAYLTNNVFVNNAINAEDIEELASVKLNYACCNNTFGGFCSAVVFNANCSNNVLCTNSSYNTFGMLCSANVLGCYCMGNIFGNSVGDNTFKSYCYFNNFGNYCEKNKCGAYFHNNTLENECYSNVYGTNIMDNSFGNLIHDIVCYDNITMSVIGSGMSFCEIKGAGNANQSVRYLNILPGINGTKNNIKVIAATANVNYTQVVGVDSNQNIKIWNPADLVQ